MFRLALTVVAVALLVGFIGLMFVLLGRAIGVLLRRLVLLLLSLALAVGIPLGLLDLFLRSGGRRIGMIVIISAAIAAGTHMLSRAVAGGPLRLVILSARVGAYVSLIFSLAAVAVVYYQSQLEHTT